MLTKYTARIQPFDLAQDRKTADRIQKQESKTKRGRPG
jgi:hypothetical protein